jgi:hypothetical protein
MKRFLFFLAYFISVLINYSCISVQPGTSENFSDSATLKKHVTQITGISFRNHLDTIALNKVASYIESEFRKYSDRVSYQPYKLSGKIYKNVICTLGPDSGERIIIGAHYDVSGNQPGADDNASGVAGLLELARLLKNQSLKYRIDLVAYTLEEPPYFKSNGMGSFIHAQNLWQNKIQVKGMICLEMIGYFDDAPKSQSYPIAPMKWFYGGTGDYILVVQRFGNGRFGRQFNRLIKKNATIKTKFLRSPKFITGIDFSDHRNYWNFDINAIMITNTAFYRNKNYHTPDDTIDKLDFTRMSKVVDQVYLSVLNIK